VIPAEFNNAGDFHWAADGKGLYVPDSLKSKSVLWYLALTEVSTLCGRPLAVAGLWQFRRRMVGLWQSQLRARAAMLG